jgi:hypothetical protein
VFAADWRSKTGGLTSTGPSASSLALWKALEKFDQKEEERGVAADSFCNGPKKSAEEKKIKGSVVTGVSSSGSTTPQTSSASGSTTPQRSPVLAFTALQKKSSASDSATSQASPVLGLRALQQKSSDPLGSSARKNDKKSSWRPWLVVLVSLVILVGVVAFYGPAASAAFIIKTASSVWHSALFPYVMMGVGLSVLAAGLFCWGCCGNAKEEKQVGPVASRGGMDGDMPSPLNIGHSKMQHPVTPPPEIVSQFDPENSASDNNGDDERSDDNGSVLKIAAAKDGGHVIMRQVKARSEAAAQFTVVNF